MDFIHFEDYMKIFNNSEEIKTLANLTLRLQLLDLTPEEQAMTSALCVMLGREYCNLL